MNHNHSSTATGGTALVNLGAPITKTDDFTVGAGEQSFINNKAGATCTVTLPTASTNTGLLIMIKNLKAFTVVSVSSNVVPISNVTPGTAILSATVGEWVTMVSDGTNWVITQIAVAAGAVDGGTF